MSDKRDQLTKAIRICYLHQKAYLSSMSDKEKEAAGSVDEWSPKDVLAHVTYWDADSASDLEDLDQVEKSGAGGGVNHINAEIWEEYKDITWKELEAMINKAHHDLIKNLGKVTEEQLEDPERYEWSDGRPIWQRLAFGSIYHPIQHLADLYLNRGQLAKANALHEEAVEGQLALDDSDSWQGNVLYNLGCHYALTGQHAQALSKISESFELSPYLKEWAAKDSDLDSLREAPDFKALLE